MRIALALLLALGLAGVLDAQSAPAARPCPRHSFRPVLEPGVRQPARCTCPPRPFVCGGVRR